MNKLAGKIIRFTGLLSVLFMTSAHEPAPEKRATVLPTDALVMVTEVTGQAEYAYDSTGWKPLEAGKILHAGAVIRTVGNSTALLRLANTTTLVRVTPASKLLLTPEPPVDEVLTTQANGRRAPVHHRNLEKSSSLICKAIQ